MFIIIILDSLISGFISTYISKLINSDIRTDLNAGYLLITDGISCIFGAILSAFLIDKYKVLNVSRAGICALLITIVPTFVNYMIEP